MDAQAAARLLNLEHQQGLKFHSISSKFGIVDLYGAYAVQDEYV